MGYFDDETINKERAERQAQEDARQRDAEAAQRAYEHWLATEARAVFADFLRKRAAISPPRAIEGSKSKSGGIFSRSRQSEGYLIAEKVEVLEYGAYTVRWYIRSGGELFEPDIRGDKAHTHEEYCREMSGIHPPLSMSKWDADEATKRLVASLRRHLVST